MDKMPRFSLNSYKELIISLKKTGRSFCSFSDQARPRLILRIDVDYDLNWAARLAEINDQLSIQATFFIQVSSPLYNVLCLDNRGALDRIVNADQHIGLHYFHDGGDLDVHRLKHEFSVLHHLVPTIENFVAWHNPNGDISLLNREAEREGFVSVYSDEFFTLEKYVSDSNGRNDASGIRKFVSRCNASSVQILLHPFNWVLGGKNEIQIIEQCFNEKSNQLFIAFSQNRVWRDKIMQKTTGADPITIS